VLISNCSEAMLQIFSGWREAKNKFPNLKKDRWIARRLANNRFICTYVSRNCRCQRVTAASSAIANWGLPEVRFWFSRFQPFFWANYRQLISAWSGIHDVERGTGKPPKMIIIIHCPMSARCFFPYNLPSDVFDVLMPVKHPMGTAPTTKLWGSCVLRFNPSKVLRVCNVIEM